MNQNNIDQIIAELDRYREVLLDGKKKAEKLHKQWGNYSKTPVEEINITQTKESAAIRNGFKMLKYQIDKIIKNES